MGGLMDLVAYGLSGTFITETPETPELTFFKIQHKQHTKTEPNHIKVKNILDLDFDIHSKCASCKKYLIERDMDCFLFYKCDACGNSV